MQIRLTVLAAPPTGGHTARRACDVLVTAPAGTALAAVASGLAAAVSGPDASGAVVLYAGRERLDPQRCALGEPPLVDGAVLSLQAPGEDDTPLDGAAARLHVVAGPDAGGVHLLHGGRIAIGRSADADVPLDDPDVSRLHCEVTVADDGRVTVADLGSTNGTTLDGKDVGSRPVRLAPGALLRLGESALRLTTGPADADGTAPATTPDGEGHLRLPIRPGTPGGAPGAGSPDEGAGAPIRPVSGGAAPVVPAARRPYGTAGGATATEGQGAGHPAPAPTGPARPGPAHTAHGPGGHGHAGQTVHTRAADVPDGAVPHSREPDPRRQATPARGTHLPEDITRRAGATPGDGTRAPGGAPVPSTPEPSAPVPSAPESSPRRRGIGAWARRLAGGRAEGPAAGRAPHDAPPGTPLAGATTRGAAPETWPDPAAVLLAALGPGARLWERGPAHPEALVVRLGTADRAGLPAVPVTVGLREAGSLALAGPRARLAGLARSAVAQLAALHAPADLETVLISADRSRPLEERKRDWGWLGWLPHSRPAHGQDCRLLLAYDRDQAAARAAELTRRLDDGPLGPGWASSDHRDVAEAAAAFDGTRTVVIVDGDPGTAALRETMARLAGAGAAAGIHLICLAEAPAASALSPVAATYETACAAAPAIRECGAVALLSGDVATALRLMRTAQGRPVGHGTVAAVDAVSVAWAERFGRALAPLRAEGGGTRGRAATALPRSARLLDELELARATPASLMARWASAPDGTAVLGAGPRGPLAVDLVAEGPHLLVEGPAGSGRTELLRSLAASLAAASRPDRLGLLLVDGSGGERGGDGLAPCMELPHAREHLVASDPVRMRGFAQALGAELKRRAELLGRRTFAEWQAAHDAADPAGARRAERTDRTERMDSTERTDRTDRADQGGVPGQRHSSERPAGTTGAGDLDTLPSGTTIRLRPARTEETPGARRGHDGGAEGAEGSGGPGLPRLVVLVDDFDALIAPALGAPGRPAAGSVVRALEAVARDGERLGVHLVTASARPDRTADTEPARHARLRVVLDARPTAPGPDDPMPGRGRLGHPDGRVTPFQGGRVTGRIPRTATLRPTVVPLEWERMGDPPTRRPVRELGNGPTDLALLASALERAARSVGAEPPQPLTPDPSHR
ncbi:FHA domain-containing protein [Streptomyces sp. NPDC047928]|uniref:FHA domain-containing protein n=1 Tax=unclassified Streptomyces TaxID=2593676 RepID=UPI00371DF29E